MRMIILMVLGRCLCNCTLFYPFFATFYVLHWGLWICGPLGLYGFLRWFIDLLSTWSSWFLAEMLSLLSWWIFFIYIPFVMGPHSLWLCARFWEGSFWIHLKKFCLSRDLCLVRCGPRVVLSIKDVIASEGFFGLLEYFVLLITFKLALEIAPLASLVAEIGQELAFAILESFRSSVWVYRIGIGIHIN